MTEFAIFGDPAKFEIALRWVDDDEPRDRRPAHGGWSTGDMRITVAHHVLTRNQFREDGSDVVSWYLLPVFEWLADHWTSILHEERFAWRENSPAPAATAIFLALRRLVDADDDLGQKAYESVQSWWTRHALRAADPSALYPDLVFRRLRDEIELSWTIRPLVHAPDNFKFALSPGAATMSISDVADPLWEALNWIPSSLPVLSSEADRQSIRTLENRISQLKKLPTAALESAYLPDGLFTKVKSAREKLHIADKSIRSKQIPVVTKLDDVVLMFGGVSPDIGATDIQTLISLLASNADGKESAQMSALVDDSVGAPLSAPFEEGYDLAEQLLEESSLPGSATFVDVRALLDRLGVKVAERSLRTSTIRGVAIAGSSYSPLIVINRTSDYNSTEPGKRFTLAHELFHLLFDRARGRRIAHTSGPWASPGVEKRANAFAAMFLMPRSLLRRALTSNKIDGEAVVSAATSMQVGVTALVEHLYNMGIIDELDRDRLRAIPGAT